jgi:arginine deiminase
MSDDYDDSFPSVDDYFRNKSSGDMKEIISDYLSDLLFKKLENDSLYRKLLDDLIKKGSDPYTAAEKIWKKKEETPQ